MNSSELINKALNQTPELVAKAKHEVAVEYLMRYMLNNKEFAELVAQGEKFKKWWHNQWLLRDNKFVYLTSLDRLDLPLDVPTLCVIADLYQDAHNVRDMRIVPNRFVRDEAIQILKAEEERLRKL